MDCYLLFLGNANLFTRLKYGRYLYGAALYFVRAATEIVHVFREINSFLVSKTLKETWDRMDYSVNAYPRTFKLLSAESA